MTFSIGQVILILDKSARDSARAAENFSIDWQRVYVYRTDEWPVPADEAEGT